MNLPERNRRRLGIQTQELPKEKTEPGEGQGQAQRQGRVLGINQTLFQIHRQTETKYTKQGSVGLNKEVWARTRSATQHYVTILWEENLKKDRYIYTQT